MVPIQEPSIKEAIFGPVQNYEILGRQNQRSAIGTARADIVVAPQEALVNPCSNLATPTSRTRADLARLLKSVFDPLERVNGSFGMTHFRVYDAEMF